MIPRIVLPKIEHWLGQHKILILKGSRQVGKTTLLKHMESTLQKKGDKTFYLSVDQEIDNPILKTSRYLGRFLKDQFHGGRLTLFLDEFQYLKQPGLFLKTLFDQVGDQVQIIASGSSSLEITKNSEFLTGRKIEFYLSPINYEEFVSYKTGLKFMKRFTLSDFSALKEFYEIYQLVLNENRMEYIMFGGYPEVVTTQNHEDKQMLLNELVRTYIEKDIIAFLRIENVTGFNMLLKLLCDQIGNLINKSELSNTTNLSMDTVSKYLDILEGTYVFDFAKPYFKNLRKELSKMPKPYCNDFGMRNVILNQISKAAYFSGEERENFVYNQLRVNLSKEDLKFYRTLSKAEIDFIAKGKHGQYAIEVKSTQRKISVPRIMESFEKQYGGETFFKVIVTDNLLEKNKEVLFLPIALVPFIEW